MKDGSISDLQEHALATDTHMGRSYAALRSCDEAFDALQQMHQSQSPEEQRQQHKRMPKLYLDYTHCATSALCPSALEEWSACLLSVEDRPSELAKCKLSKKLLERCMRGETQQMLRASQPQVFRPKV